MAHVGGAALAQIVDRRVQALGGDAGLLQRVGRGVPLASTRASSRRSAVTKLSPAFLASLLGLLEQARGFRRQ